MKKFLRLMALCTVISAAAMGADYSEGLRSKDYKWSQINMFHVQNHANAFGDTYHNTYLQVEGGGRSGFLNLYYFVDVNNFLDSGQSGKKDDHGDFFLKIAPKFSIDAMTGRDLSIGPVKEWFISTQYKGFNDMETYYVGFGVDWDAPFFDSIASNLYATYRNTSLDNGSDADWDYSGIVLATNWYTVLTTFENGANLSYQGWMDIGFNNDYAERNGGTHDEFQMYNGFYYNKENYSLSYSVKLHNHFSYNNTENHDAVTHFFGVHYRM